MRKLKRASKSEPTTALINIVFLILIFFMVAGTLSGPLGESIEFVETRGLDCCAPPDALAISADGALTYKGAALETVDDFFDQHGEAGAPVKLLPDRNLPAQDLLRLVRSLREQGAEHVVIMTENTSP